METRTLEIIGLLTLNLWNFFAAAFLPRLVNSTTKVGVIALLVGFTIFFGFEFLAPRGPQMIWVFTITTILCALIGMVHFLILERRRTGRWTFLDAEQRKL